MFPTSLKACRRILFLLFVDLISLNAWSIGNCPPVGQSPSCGVLITVTTTGALTFQFDPSVPPFDGVEDTLVGVQNDSGATIYGIFLSGSGIFGFDGDGAFGGSYGGPGMSFNIIDANSGTVNFDNGLVSSGFAYFSLEGAPTASNLATSVTLDPGHGTSCDGKPQKSGAVGTTFFPDLPAPGFLQENVLSVSVAMATQTLLANGQYRVELTKTNVADCPSWKMRADAADNNNSNFFVSIHLNEPVGAIKRRFCGTGTSVLYNPSQADGHTLALDLLSSVSNNVGVGVLETGSLCSLIGDNSNANHDGTYPRPNLAVLKLSKPVAAVVELGRLSPPDDATIHDASFLSNAANGIKSGLDAFIHP